MQDNVKKMLLTTIPLLMMGLGLLFAILLIVNVQERNKVTDTYLRFEVCNLNVPPSIKTQAVLDRCWDRAEKSTGVKVDHFGE